MILNPNSFQIPYTFNRNVMDIELSLNQFLHLKYLLLNLTRIPKKNAKEHLFCMFMTVYVVCFAA